MPRIRQKADVYRNEDFRRDVLVQLAYLGMNQKDAARNLGVCDATVSNLLNRPDKLTVDRLRKLIVLLKLKPDTVLRLLGYQTKAIREVMDE